MANLYDVDPTELIKEVAKELKELNIDKPEWTDFVKTGVHKERNPLDRDWWYLRCASILRKVYIFGPIGTQKLRRYYGGRKNRGHKPEKFFKGSGSIVRNALQSLEKIGFISKVDAVNKKKGRIITNKGKSFVDKASFKVYQVVKLKKTKTEKTE